MQQIDFGSSQEFHPEFQAILDRVPFRKNVERIRAASSEYLGEEITRSKVLEYDLTAEDREKSQVIRKLEIIYMNRNSGVRIDDLGEILNLINNVVSNNRAKIYGSLKQIKDIIESDQIESEEFKSTEDIESSQEQKQEVLSRLRNAARNDFMLKYEVQIATQVIAELLKDRTGIDGEGISNLYFSFTPLSRAVNILNDAFKIAETLPLELRNRIFKIFSQANTDNIQNIPADYFRLIDYSGYIDYEELKILMNMLEIEAIEPGELSVALRAVIVHLALRSEENEKLISAEMELLKSRKVLYELEESLLLGYADATSKIDFDLENLYQYLNSKYFSIRTYSLRLLGKKGPEAVAIIPRLLAMAEDFSKPEILEVYSALVQIGHQEERVVNFIENLYQEVKENNNLLNFDRKRGILETREVQVRLQESLNTSEKEIEAGALKLQALLRSMSFLSGSNENIRSKYLEMLDNPSAIFRNNILMQLNPNVGLGIEAMEKIFNRLLLTSTVAEIEEVFNSIDKYKVDEQIIEYYMRLKEYIENIKSLENIDDEQRARFQLLNYKIRSSIASSKNTRYFPFFKFFLSCFVSALISRISSFI